MKIVMAVLAAAVVGAVVWAIVVFAGREPRLGDDEPTPARLTKRDIRVLAMDLLQDAVAQEMRLFVREERFTADPDELGSPQTFEPGPGIASFGKVSVEVCAGERVVVLGTTGAGGDVLAVKARGLDPPEEGEAVFSHYTSDPPCDESDGPETWPGGYHVSRQGLMKGDERAEIPLA